MDDEPPDPAPKEHDASKTLSEPDSFDLDQFSKRQWVRDWLWGYDFFISYHWNSGGRYAVALAQRLRDENFEVFLDRADYASGDDWKKIGQVALRNTQWLILVATNEAVFQSQPVEREVVAFTRRSRQIVPVCFGYSLNPAAEAPDGYSVKVWERIRGSMLGIVQPVFIESRQLRTIEPGRISPGRPNKPITDQKLPDKPSQRVIKELIRTHRILRRRRLRSRLVMITLVILGAFACAASISWWRERQANTKVVAQLVKSHIRESEAHLRNGDLCYALPYAVQALVSDSTPNEIHRARVNSLQSQTPVPVAFMPQQSEITHIATSRDGSLLLCTDLAGRATVWRTSTGEHLATLQHSGVVSHGSFNSDGSMIVTASADHTARLWNWSNQTHRVLPHQAVVRRAWFALSDRSIVTAAIEMLSNSSVAIWQIGADDVQKKKEFSIKDAQSATLSNDGLKIAVVTWGTPTARGYVQVTVIDVTTLTSHTMDLKSVVSVDDFRFTDDSEWILATGHGRVYAWNAETGKPATLTDEGRLSQTDVETAQPLTISRFLSDDVKYALIIPGDETVFVTGHTDGALRFTRMGDRPHVVIPARGAIRTVDYDDHAGLIKVQTTLAIGDTATDSAVWNAAVHFSSANASTVRVYDSKTGFPVLPPLHHQGEIRTSEFVPKKSQIVTGGADGLAIVWITNDDMTGFRELVELSDVIDGNEDVSIEEVRLFHDASGAHAIGIVENSSVPNTTYSVVRWDATTGFASSKSLWGGQKGSSRMTDAGETAIAIGSRILVIESQGEVLEYSIAMDDGELQIQQFDKQQIVATGNSNSHIWRRDTGRYFSIAVPDMKPFSSITSSTTQLALADRSSISLVDLLLRKPLFEVKTADFGLHHELISLENGRLLLVGEQPHALLIDPAGRSAKELAHSSQCVGASYEQHRNSVTTFSADGTIRIWDARTGSLRMDVSNCAGKVVKCRYSQDGRWLLAIIADHGAQLLNALSGELIGPTQWSESRLLDAICIPGDREIQVLGLSETGATRAAPAVLSWSIPLAEVEIDRTKALSAAVSGLTLDPSGTHTVLNATERLAHWNAFRTATTGHSQK